MSKIFFSCEHASSEIPEEFKKKLAIPDKILNSHAGYDIGARNVCEHFSKEFGVPGFYGEFSRLLVDLNRSYESRNLFSEYSRKLTYIEKEKIVNLYYEPYRRKIEGYTESIIRKGQSLVHISVHSFTPVFKGQTRYTDIGILYDPARDKEKEFAYHIRHEMEKLSPREVKMNYPYLGISDGLTTYLRKVYKADQYLGLEIEINQKLLVDKKNLGEVCDPLSKAIKNVFQMKLF